MKKHFIIFLAAIFCCNINAQNNNDTLSIRRSESGQIRFAEFKVDANSNRKMQNDTSFLKAVLNAKTGDSFRKIKDYTDEVGITHRRFQQYYKGIKVEHAQYLVHGKDGNIETINGDFRDVDISLVSRPMNEQVALEKALLYVGAQQYKWEDAGMEAFAKQNTGNPNATYYPKGELVISKDYLGSSGTFKLSWKFTISSMIPNNEQLIYVDANNGAILNDIPLTYSANTSATAQTLYNGTKSITCDSYSGNYRLQETRNGVNVQTKNMNYASMPYWTTDFVNNSTSWTSGNWTTFNQDQCALDVHWGAEKVLDYWRTVFNRNSIDDNGLRVLSYVHVGGIMQDNARWAEGTNNNYMEYGDGVISNSFTSLDICAHEFGHGITQFEEGPVHNDQESGALNEGFSDIWGACIEHWAAPSKQTWLIGEELYDPTSYSCLRNLQNPKSTTTLEGPSPDTYHGDFWSYDGNPYPNSAVLSHWFYILSEGKTGTNDLGKSYSVTGIGIAKAQKIAYGTLRRLTQDSEYIDAYNAAMAAVSSLYGYSDEYIAVNNAWYAVGVAEDYLIPITGPPHFYSTATFHIENLPPNSTVTLNTPFNFILSLSGNTISIDANGYSGEGWFSATVTSDSHTITSNTVHFLCGSYCPEAVLFRYICLNENGELPRDVYDLYNRAASWEDECIMYDWCDGFSDNRFALTLVPGIGLNTSVLAQMLYEARVVQRGTGTVVWSSSSSFWGTTVMEVEYYGVIGTVYDLEVRLPGSPPSEWSAVGEVYSHFCSSSSGIVESAAQYSLFPNPSSGSFTLQRTQTETTLSSQTSLSSSQTIQPETLKLRFYALPTGAFIKEMTVTTSGNTSVNSGISQPGNYLVRILKNNVPLAAIPFSIE
jgi:Zn-dependent metalloprotease